jgi:hypothetical protein
VTRIHKFLRKVNAIGAQSVTDFIASHKKNVMVTKKIMTHDFGSYGMKSWKNSSNKFPVNI